MSDLSDEFLNQLVIELDNEDIVGIILGGSYARGEAAIYSDVDIACFVKDDAQVKQKRYEYRDGRLISIASKSLASMRRDMARPESAILFVSGIRRILLDKDGSVSRLFQEMDAFSWNALQKAANEYASFRMIMSAEQAHKIMNAFLQDDELAMSYATSKLLFWLTDIIAVQRGVLIKSDSTYYRQVEESVGPDSAWSCCHRIVTGVDRGTKEETPVRAQGKAALCLYRETAELLWSVMKPDHLLVVEQAIDMIVGAQFTAPTTCDGAS